jgi:hypothetical protein
MTDAASAITLLLAKATEEFPRIIGQPTDDDVFRIREALMPLLHNIEYANFVPAGGNAHNLVGIIQETAAYTADWNAPFPRPARPPPYDINIADDATNVVKNRMEAAHRTLIEDHNAYIAAEKGTSTFIQTVVEEVWYKDLRNALTFYNNVTAYAILEHITTNSGGLHNNELVNLPTEMLSYYEEAEGIPEFLLKLAKAREKLARGGLPMSDQVLLATASSQVFKSMHFPEATREWERLPAASKTWAAWQIKYREAHIERKRLLMANPDGFGGTAYNVTNAAIGYYFGNMANAATIAAASATANATATNAANTAAANAATNAATIAAANAATIAATTATAAKATATAAANATANAANNDIATLTAQIKALTAQINKTPGDKRGGNRRPPKIYTQAEALVTFNVQGYCSTHGYRVHPGHNSATCKFPNKWHNKDATRADTKRGCNKNKGWETNPNPM